MERGFKVLLLLLAIAIVLPIRVIAAAETTKSLVITEVKTGGPIDGQPTEFLQIANVSDEDLVVDGFVVEYAKPTAQITDCGKLWSLQDSSSAVKGTQLSGIVPAGSSLVVELSMNDNAGGALHIMNGENVLDTVGWGTSVSLGVCAEGEAAVIPEKGKSIKRYVDSNQLFVDTEINSDDFTLSELPLIGAFPIVPGDEVDVCTNIDGLQTTVPVGYDEQNGICVPVPEEVPTLSTLCEGLTISEVLPNPEGTDTGNEFIELYNGTGEIVKLEGCSLKVGTSTKDLQGTMSPGYKAFYGIVLPNAAGGTVELISAGTEEVVVYPADLGDNEAWANVLGNWQITNQPTPDSVNLASVVVSESSTEEELAPCPEGKYRNPETNRCKNVDSDDGTLKACAADQYRNPETNRCKKIADALAELKPCEEGQYRNPETNRCRKISSDGTELKACDKGEERNEETNRCRKVAGVSTDKPSDQENNSSNVNYIIIGLFAATTCLYGIYEYRDSIGNIFSRIKSKVTK